MKARFVIQETTQHVEDTDGWHEVMITDTVTGNVAKGRGKTYKEAEQEAWLNLKAMQPAGSSIENLTI